MLGWAVVPPLLVACVDELLRRPGAPPGASSARCSDSWWWSNSSWAPRSSCSSASPPCASPSSSSARPRPPDHGDARGPPPGRGAGHRGRDRRGAPGLADLVRAGRAGPRRRGGCGRPWTWDRGHHPARLPVADPGIGRVHLVHPPGRWLSGPDPVGPVRRASAWSPSWPSAWSSPGATAGCGASPPWPPGRPCCPSASVGRCGSRGRLVAGRPLLENIIPSRFVLVTYLSLAVALGLVVDRAPGLRSVAGRGPAAGGPRRWAPAAAGLAVVAVALVPVAAYLAPTVPMVTQPVRAPAWFTAVAPRLAGHPVLLVFPVPEQVIESAMAWQAVTGFPYHHGRGRWAGRGGPARRRGAGGRRGHRARLVLLHRPGPPSGRRGRHPPGADGLGGDRGGPPRRAGSGGLRPGDLGAVHGGIRDGGARAGAGTPAGSWVWTGVGAGMPAGPGPTPAALARCVASGGPAYPPPWPGSRPACWPRDDRGRLVASAPVTAVGTPRGRADPAR